MKIIKREYGKRPGMRITKVMILIAIICALCVLSFPVQGVAAKGPQGEENIVPQTVYLSDHSSVYSYGGRVKDKEAAITAIENYLSANLAPTGTVQLLSYGYTLDGSQTNPYGNAYVWAMFHSHLDLDLPAGFATRVSVVSGSYSFTAWVGSSPQYNSDVIKLIDSWTWTGIAISINIPPGAGFSVGGTTVTWGPEYVYNNYWYMRHYFSGLTGSGLLIKFGESSTGSHRFQGIDWVTAYATKSMWV